MRTRAIRDLSQKSDRDFFREVATGLDCIAQNATRLEEDARFLSENRHVRGRRLVQAVAAEEAAKFLILVDAVRCPRRPPETFSRHSWVVSTTISARACSLARELCQGRESFANHVLVARRQGLIAEAAAILTELSSGRLTFAEDVAATFSVLDTGTGSVRDPRLLSGGEQFQASLALALGLVEIAARAGSRIECLFLDEGFGALDPASLDTALDALESAARRGRRIVAVTHVDAVTARADQVLGVAGSESGSHVAWRGTELGTMA